MATSPPPSAATFNGYSAPQAPGPEIGEIRASVALSFTAPDFMQAASASARQASRSAVKKPPPQPASDTRTSEPKRYQETLRVMARSLAPIYLMSSQYVVFIDFLP